MTSYQAFVNQMLKAEHILVRRLDVVHFLPCLVERVRIADDSLLQPLRNYSSFNFMGNVSVIFITSKAGVSIA